VRRLVIDTNIYIDWFGREQHGDLLFQRDTVKYLSAVVLMELLVGAYSPPARRFAARLEKAFQSVGRVLTPSALAFHEAGEVLRRLKDRGYKVSGSHSIVNDVLIALSARSIGATVVTSNVGDFLAIRAIRPFKLLLVKAS
jgi:predicted nucleic acid-binding protein